SSSLSSSSSSSDSSSSASSSSSDSSSSSSDSSSSSSSSSSLSSSASSVSSSSASSSSSDSSSSSAAAPSGSHWTTSFLSLPLYFVLRSTTSSSVPAISVSRSCSVLIFLLALAKSSPHAFRSCAIFQPTDAPTASKNVTPLDLPFVMVACTFR